MSSRAWQSGRGPDILKHPPANLPVKRNLAMTHLAPRKGFTIVELMVVVAMIALLLAMLAPALDKAISMAERVACGALERKYGMANAMYANEFKHWFVPIKTAGTGEIPRDISPVSDAIPPGTLPVDLDRRDIFDVWFHNAAYIRLMGLDKENIDPVYGNYWRPSYMCPNTPADRNKTGWVFQCYGFVWSLKVARWEDTIAIKRTKLPWPSDQAQFVDSTNFFCAGPYAAWAEASPSYEAHWDNPPGGGDAVGKGVAYRHEEGANIQFFDGSVRWMHKYDAWTYSQDRRPESLERDGKLWDVYPDRPNIVPWTP